MLLEPILRAMLLDAVMLMLVASGPPREIADSASEERSWSLESIARRDPRVRGNEGPDIYCESRKKVG
jgi:hypothetical protein